VTPTGIRFDGENYIFRDAQIWLSDHMLARLKGLPLIAGMIDGALNSAEFVKRVIGTVMHGYVRDNSLWCVARICNNFALRVIQSGKYETRVTATFDDDAPPQLTVEAPANLLFASSDCRIKQVFVKRVQPMSYARVRLHPGPAQFPGRECLATLALRD
jgi:hypothetical protein